MEISMEPLISPSVAIDGSVIRRIREESRLTQLYVAKVVGVTTDTVSRWENNRYPTIMRDNALKLAEALEVDLEEILQKDPLAVSAADHLLQQSKKKNWLFLLFLAGSGLSVLFFLFQFNSTPVPVLQATRILPHYAAPGSHVLIQVKLSAEKPLRGMILKETFPPGWHLLEAEPVASHVDSDAGVARWIFRKPLLDSRVFYILTVPENILPDTNISITGEIIANPEGQRSAVMIPSVGKMETEPFHWADVNGDLVIDDVEILEVSDLTEEAKTLNLDWDLIESIWETGAYRWDPEKKQFTPVSPPDELI
jgi:transcriptional regulator with XRE-family HTH domain